MAPFLAVIWFTLLAAPLCALPRRAGDFFSRSRFHDDEASGDAGNDPVRGSVRVFKLSPHFLRHAPGVLRKPAELRSSFPAFLALGRAGPPAPAHAPAAPRPHLRTSSTEHEDRRRQGMEVWRRAMQRTESAKETVSLPLSSMDAATQKCTALPFNQRITEEGCEAVTIHNKLCFGQCSSMFVPSIGGAELHRGGAPCSRCAPSKARTVLVRMRCGLQVRERSVMLVEECVCESGQEENKITAYL